MSDKNSRFEADWVADPGLVNEVQEQFDRAIAAYRANASLIGEHVGLEESIRTGGYAKRTLLELVQNAADAMSGAGEATATKYPGRVEIVLDPDTGTLYCANAGRPFSKSGLVTLAQAYLSKKRGDEIGRFGLGFKSVLAVTETPQIFSRSVSFEFNSTEARKAVSEVKGDARQIPILRTPTVTDPLEQFASDPILGELAEWATTIVKLPQANAKTLKRLRQEIAEFSSEFLLFVSSVREIKLRVLGDDGLDTSHVSRDLGAGKLKIERPDGSGEEWIVQDAMHSPSAEARQEVGEAVSRSKVKVTVAMPVRHSQRRIGQFWSYFPLIDTTSASALFNAPWSVNDDRTTLLRNDYNREILRTLAEVFVEILPRVSTSEDPAAHLDYLPARGREERSFGDGQLCTLVPKLSTKVPLIPGVSGELLHANDLLPLDFAFDTSQIDEDSHREWIASPNTADDVPHWRCYGTPQRFTRLRQLFALGVDPDLLEEDGRDMKRALELMPKRGLLTWLKEWADGDDASSAAQAIEFVLKHPRLTDIFRARVLPTTDGLRALSDKNVVFLEQEEGITIEGAVFVEPLVLAQPGVRKLLVEAGFRNLDPIAILRARVAQLSSAASGEDLAKFWDAVLGVSIKDALEVLRAHPHASVKVPTRDGSWAWPRQVIDLDEPLSHESASMLLDRQRCLPQIAHSLGVVREPLKNYDFDDEPLRDDYTSWVVNTLNASLGLGERPIDRVSLYPKLTHSPGPFSMLLVLRDSNGSLQLRESWTRSLLSFGDAQWDCEDVDSGANYKIDSPVRWAVDRAGIVNSTRGYRSPSEVVAPSLMKFRDLLPLFVGPGSIVDILNLPDTIEEVPVEILRDAMEAELLPSAIDDDVLTEFIVTASKVAYPGTHPRSIPARVGRAVESRPPSAVYVAVSDEQRDFLAARQRPFLQATETRATELVEIVGCRKFEDTFAFSMVVEGEQSSERVLDVFTGLRGTFAESALTNASITRAAMITKRVTTQEGVEDQSLESHLDGVNLFVQNAFDERELLSIVNDAFNLRLTNAELDQVRKAGLDHHLEELRQQACAATSDTERLEIYFGEDDLRDELPNGLWHALEAQDLVDSSTSVADLYLTVYGSDSIRQLRDLFSREGFPDVPSEWAGGARAISWLRKMGFGTEYAGRRAEPQDAEFVVPGKVQLSELHPFQQTISGELGEVLTTRTEDGRALKAMVELPTGAGKTRVATETVLRLFVTGELEGTILWIAQSRELCEQAVQTWSTVWRGLGDERPLTIGRLWEGNVVHEPDTEFSIIVATDAMLDSIHKDPEYEWLSTPAAVIIDEGHRAGDSERYTRLLTWLGVAGRGWARPLVGLSATPFRGTSEEGTRRLASRFGNRKLRAFESNPYHELASLGVLARVNHQVLEGVDVSLTSSERNDATRLRRINPTVLDRIGRDHERMSVLVHHIMGLDESWPVLVFTPSVLSAQVLAATLRYRGIDAESVSGQTGRQRRREVIDKFKRNEIRVLTNCDLLIQGFDAPGVRALYIARPTFSPNAYIQMAGRGLRGPLNGGKEECLIVDMADNFGDINELLGFREYEELWKEQQG
ncbi:DEAD/DEAH box helicase family protein [Mycolicibacterium sp. 050232]|uniref:sacsin N-terminal ATP-binding-like domain-containing protein n=1 Tax=Mycolicibacterium sp. 050232 TaxID=3113982 RepID=UPI002E29A83F|nr:DEAD/DEAH box helicase family protein [Mycolicibacterium sp. 050232]MED5812894.1 DEAD/DEAH box helicase family protein [Mycolicibacterium sp. 050232]